MARHLPLIAWSGRDLINERNQLDLQLQRIDKELARRDGRDEEHFGFPVSIHTPGVISTAYRHFPTRCEAYAAAVKEAGDDKGAQEVAPYQVHSIYLGKDD